MKRVVAAVVMMMTCGVLAAGARETVLDALVARVDGRAVTWSQVLREAEIRRLEGRSEAERLPRVVLDALVRRELLVAEAERLRLKVEAAEVERALRELEEACCMRLQRLAEQVGVTQEDLRRRQHRILMAEKYLRLRREMTFVPMSEVRAFYWRHRDRFGNQGFAEVRGALRAYLVERRYQKELNAWFESQKAQGRVELLTLPGTNAP